MANIVIVSKHCYLLCDSINSIHIDVSNIDNSLLQKEDPTSIANIINNIKRPKNHKKRPPRTALQKMSVEEYAKKIEATSGYQITINYNAIARQQGQTQLEEKYVQFTVLGYDKAMEAYREVVKQLREQIPDQMFLNELVDRLLEDADDSKDTNQLPTA